MATELIYRLQVSKDSDFIDTVFYTTVESVTSATFQHLDNSTTYYWRVKGVNPFNGNESVWSSACTFKTVGVDLTLTHITSLIDFVATNNDLDGSQCSFIGNSLNNLKNRDVLIDGRCSTVGLYTSALSDREVD